MEAEEVEALLPVAQADDPGLVRVQMQPERLQGLRGQDTRMLRAFSGGTQDDEVVAVAHQLPQSLPVLSPCLVQDVQGDVGEQREES